MIIILSTMFMTSLVEMFQKSGKQQVYRNQHMLRHQRVGIQKLIKKSILILNLKKEHE